MKDNLEIKSTRLLLVEGNDECWFFIQLLQFLGLNQNPSPLDLQVIDIEGRTRFSSSLSILAKYPDFNKVKVVGFVRDAEDNLANSSYTSMASAIKKSLPDFPIPAIGTVTKNNGFACGVFIMPNNIDKGMLEDLCIDSVKSEPLYGYANQYVMSAYGLLSSSDQKKYNTHKAMVQTYLAGKPEIVNTLANAAKKNIWDFNNPVFDGIKDFIRKLAVA